MKISGEQHVAAPTVRQKLAIGLLAAILVLSPLKFANSVSSHVFSHFPQDTIQVVLSPWPTSWAPVLAAVALIAVILANSVPPVSFFRKTWAFWIAPAITLVACFAGWINTDNYLQPISFTVHIAGVLAFTLAVLIQLAYCPVCRKQLLIAFGIGVLLLCLFAAYEYFWSFKFTLAHLEKIAAEHGPGSVDPQIIARLKQNRPQAGFPIPNSLGGHFVMVMPLVVACLFLVGQKVDPPKVSRVLLPLLAGVTLCFFTYTTKSRAATLSAFVAIIACAAMIAIRNRSNIKKYSAYYIAGALVIPFLAILAYLAIRDGRSLSSLGARLTYWENGWQMFTGQPIFGLGIGEFFHNFVRMKPEGAETARLPHSMFIFFASGCGISGVVAVTVYLLTPVIVFVMYAKKHVKTVSPVMLYGSLMGATAWLLHSQTDFNVHIPASLMTLSFCLVISIDLSPPQETVKATPWLPVCLVGIVIIVASSSALRIPGDYYLARMDQKVSRRRQHPQAAPPLETLLPIVEKGSTWSPGSLLFWERFGMEALNEKRYDLALKAFSEVVRINPHYAPGHFRQATALTGLKRLDEARTAFKSGLEWNPYPNRYNELRVYLFPDSASGNEPESEQDDNEL